MLASGMEYCTVGLGSFRPLLGTVTVMLDFCWANCIVDLGGSLIIYYKPKQVPVKWPTDCRAIVSIGQFEHYFPFLHSDCILFQALPSKLRLY